MFQQDYILRQIENLASFLAKVIFNKSSVKYDIIQDSSMGTDLLYTILMDMIKKGQINEAENMLFEEIDINNKRYLEVAVDFYSEINTLSDDDLEKYNFSRQEIYEGLKEVTDKYNIKKVL